MKLFIDDAHFKDFMRLSDEGKLMVLDIVNDYLSQDEYEPGKQSVVLDIKKYGNGSAYAELIDADIIRVIEHVVDDEGEFVVISINPYWMIKYPDNIERKYRSVWDGCHSIFY